jgi:hypothetical protein
MGSQWQNPSTAAGRILSGAGISNRWQFHCLGNSGGRRLKGSSYNSAITVELVAIQTADSGQKADNRRNAEYGIIRSANK